MNPIGEKLGTELDAYFESRSMHVILQDLTTAVSEAWPDGGRR